MDNEKDIEILKERIKELRHSELIQRLFENNYFKLDIITPVFIHYAGITVPELDEKALSLLPNLQKIFGRISDMHVAFMKFYNKSFEGIKATIAKQFVLLYIIIAKYYLQVREKYKNDPKLYNEKIQYLRCLTNNELLINPSNEDLQKLSNAIVKELEISDKDLTDVTNYKILNATQGIYNELLRKTLSQKSKINQDNFKKNKSMFYANYKYYVLYCLFNTVNIKAYMLFPLINRNNETNNKIINAYIDLLKCNIQVIENKHVNKVYQLINKYQDKIEGVINCLKLTTIYPLNIVNDDKDNIAGIADIINCLQERDDFLTYSYYLFKYLYYVNEIENDSCNKYKNGIFFAGVILDKNNKTIYIKGNEYTKELTMDYIEFKVNEYNLKQLNI